MAISSFKEYFEEEFFRDIDRTAKYSARKTGFENIDALQVFMPGLYVLGALPGSGKTTFAWQLLNQLAERGEMCIYCSFEMSKAELFTIDRSPFICVDYLQIIPSKGNKALSAKEKIDEVMLRLKDFQRETQTTVIVISAFNRENYWQPVSFSSFKESGAIEYSSDVIWGLENYGADASGNLDKSEVVKMSKAKVRERKFSCLKNRNGGVYETFFHYHAMYDYFKPCKDEEFCMSRRYEH